MTKTRLLVIFFLAFILAIPAMAQAFSVKTGDSVYIPQGEVIDGNLYAVGAAITIDGDVKGDVICGGQTLNINGKVDGDVICGAQSVNINNEIGGNLRVMAQSINIKGNIARNVNAAGGVIVLEKGANVGWDMLVAGGKTEIRGKVNGNLHGASSKVAVTGEIGKDINIRIDEGKKNKTGELDISDSAIIGGNIYYTAANAAIISDQASIAGEVKHNLPKIDNYNKRNVDNWVWGRLYSIFAAFAVGLVLISLWRKQIMELTENMFKKVGSSIGWGAVVTIMAPIIAILLFITIIGIPLAMILMGVWLIALFVGKILVGIMVGRAFLDKLWQKKKDSLIWAMIIGIAICWIIFSLPILGWLLGLVAVWWGMGGIWLYFRKA